MIKKKILKVSRLPLIGNPFMAPIKNKVRYGMPVHLFGDKDKDRVPNVFDCKPFDPKRQDKKQKEIKEESKTNCPGCGYKKPFKYIGLCPECEGNENDN